MAVVFAEDFWCLLIRGKVAAEIDKKHKSVHNSQILSCKRQIFHLLGEFAEKWDFLLTKQEIRDIVIIVENIVVETTILCEKFLISRI